MQQKSDLLVRWLALLITGAVLLGCALVISPSYANGAQQSTPAIVMLSTPSPAPTPNDVQRAMYFNSAVRDSANCDVTLNDGNFAFGAGVTNPAMSCPDAFAWRLFIQGIQEQFWQRWAADQYTWPEQPLPLCTGDATEGPCCTPGSLNNLDNHYLDDPDNPALYCPYYPGDHVDAANSPSTLQGQPLFKSQVNHFALRTGESDVTLGRTIRQEMAELVFRNEPMFDYIFTNNLYNREGVAAVFAQTTANQQKQPPYRLSNRDYTTATIDFPVDSVMIKSNWLSKERAQALGLDDDPANPYISMEITRPILDDNFPDDRFEKGIYYLVALHISSKDIPNWVWATFEHVNNPGRCDYTGCNDSFGYHSPDAVAAGQANNFTQPQTVNDGLVISSTIFATGQHYPGGEISEALQGIFTQLGIGETPQRNARIPTLDAKAWRSYRLKGSQVTFTDATGRPIRLGNSITEGGFVNSSSCMGCHARAAADAQGGHPLGVFIADLSETGYSQAALMPDPDWYYTSSNQPQLQALQTDFVWGFLFAHKILTDTQGIK